jgi:hypothetical protein
VSAQARPKIRVVTCRSSCRDPRHNTTLAFMSCRLGPKFIVSCRASGRAKISCFVRPINSTAQVPTLLKGVVLCSRSGLSKSTLVGFCVCSSGWVTGPDIFNTLGLRTPFLLNILVRSSPTHSKKNFKKIYYYYCIIDAPLLKNEIEGTFFRLIAIGKLNH